LGLKPSIENGAVTILGHGRADPGVSKMVSHHVVAGTRIVVLGNQGPQLLGGAEAHHEGLGLTDPCEVAEAQD
jgi:hypothetical protein